MRKGGLLKTLRSYKSTLLIFALLLIIAFSIFNTQKRKIIEHNTNMSKKFLEITAFTDISDGSTLQHDVLKVFDELKIKYIDYKNVIFKVHPVADYTPWLRADKIWDEYLKNNKQAADSLSQTWPQLAPIVAVSLLDKTKGDTPAKGAVRNLLRTFHKASKPQEIDNSIDTIPGFMALIGQEPVTTK